MYYGFIYDEEDNKVDEVLAVIMRAPYSYTGEDGRNTLSRRYNFHKKNYGAGIEKGSSYGRDRRVYKRGFLNGRIDLAQSEAVIDIITANR